MVNILIFLTVILLIGVIARQIWQIIQIKIRHRHSLTMLLIKIIGVAIFLSIAVIHGESSGYIEHVLLVGFSTTFCLSFLTIGLAEDVLFVPKRVRGGSVIGFKVPYTKIETCKLLMKSNKIQCRFTFKGKKRSLFSGDFVIVFNLEQEKEVIKYLEERGVFVEIKESA